MSIIISSRSLVREAYDRGKDAARVGRLRVSPYYNERVLMRGKRIDITPMLETFWLAGFDGEAYPDKPSDDLPSQPTA